MISINQYIEEISITTVPWSGYIYHYIFNKDLLDKILRSGKLVPVNRLGDPKRLEHYKDRIPGLDAEGFFKDFYNRVYKPVLKKPYRNWGIYMTPLDLSSFTDLKYRFFFKVKDLPGDTVIQLRFKAHRVTSDADIARVMKNFEDINKIKRLYKTSKFHFQSLPQVVNFSDEIKVSRRNLEKL